MGFVNNLVAGNDPFAPPTITPPNFTGGNSLTAAARETAAGNLANAQAATVANRSNISGPTGSSTWVKDPTTGQWTQTNTLNPALTGMLSTAQTNYQNALNTPLSVGNLASNIQPSGPLATNVANNPLISSIPMNANQMITSAGDPNLLNQNVTNALYQQQTSMLDPQFQRQQSSMENQLANQGITRGSEAWNNAMNEFNMNKNQAYQSAMNNAIGQGVGAANTLYGNQLAGAGFTNQALQGQFGQGLQAAGFYNQAQGQQFGQGMQNAQLQNTAQGQQFGQNAQQAALQNAAAQQALTGNLAIQNQYGNQLGGLYGMTPTGTNYNQQATAGPDILGALTQQMQMTQNAQNAQAAANANAQAGMYGLLGAGLGGIGAAGGMAAFFSDRRLKKNIKRIGKLMNGLPVYLYEYLWGEKSIGCMADEVEKFCPNAVITLPSGYKAVRYGMIGV